ncbi:MAG: FAD-dependent oxidoreductase [Verrucomicrobiota bacterium]|jgi:thioredoxin reductase (NADPH)|nr:FAD-dependent oxidoreductase [Verrucomicrobiota bacterium]
MKNLIILGSGPAGLTAAVYAARAGLAPLVLDGPLPGGPLITTSHIENIPGFPDGVAGFEFIERLRRQAQKFNASFQGKSVTAFAPLPKGGGILTLDDASVLSADAVIIATGTKYRLLGVEGEKELAGHGVSYCATCDGAFYRGRHIAVVGGGDSAMEEALFLTRFASRVTVIHRRAAFRASEIMAKRVMEHPRIQIHWNAAVERLIATDGNLSGLRLRDTVSGQESTLEADALFVAVGMEPVSGPFAGFISTTEGGYLLTNGVLTELPGVFVAGNVADARYRQAVTAAGSGCQAAIEATHFLNR